MWVTFGGLCKDDIGWASSKWKSGNGYTYVILYSEGQMYPAEFWDGNYVKEFDDLSDAIKYSMKFHDDDFKTISDRIKEKFPKHFKENGKCARTVIGPVSKIGKP